MPAWVWVLLSLSALGFVLWLLDNRGLNATDRFGKALAILLTLALLVGLVLSIANVDWQ